jgi:predicted AAA+ superfamily ATPase
LKAKKLAIFFALRQNCAMSQPTQNRYLEPFILKDLPQKMVFLAGPRQVGKTTLAIQVAHHDPNPLYLSWDRREDRRTLLKAQWPAEPTVIVLDELHKYRRWKRWIKGEYDRFHEKHHFIVTGSARLDIYRRGGDSLQGRYHHYRLHPFSLSELAGNLPTIKVREGLPFPPVWNRDLLDPLLQWSGFPEPILAQDDGTHRRWQKERLDRFFREDVRDLENVREISSMQLLSDLLPERVGSLLSLNALREDLEVSHRAISHWMDILERLYFLFRVRPYNSRKAHGLKKAAKLYLWDGSAVPNPGARYENLIASHLLKLCHFLEDTQGYRVDLCYLRDLDKREVDFLVTVEGKPWFAVEAKMSDTTLSPNLLYFGDRLKIPYLYQVVQQTEKDFMENGVHVLPAGRFLSALV